MSHDGTDDIIQAGTPGDGSDEGRTALGLATSHAYTVLSVVTLESN